MFRKFRKYNLCFYSLLTIFLSLCIVNISFGAVLFQDNFNYTDSFGNHGWSAGPTSSIAVGAGPDGSNALKITFNAGDVNRWHDWVPSSKTLNDVWIKFDYKLDCGGGSCKGGGKWLKIFGGNYMYPCDSTHPNASLGTWGGSSYDGVFDVMQYGGGGNSSTCMDVGNNIPVGVNARDNQWHTFKLHATYNTNGQSNGVYEVWHDGVKKVNVSNVINRGDAAPNYIGAVELGGWNQNYGGTPYYYYYDNVIVSTTDPDSGGASAPAPASLALSPPSGLKITN
jgi:hypothetical protein